MHSPSLSVADVIKDDNSMVINFAGVNIARYLITIYRNGIEYAKYTTTDPKIRIINMPNGNYTAEIRGQSVNGQLTDAIKKQWSINYDLQGVSVTAELFAIKLDWTNPRNVLSSATINIYSSKTTKPMR